MTGRHPERTSYCSPWVLSTIKHRAVASPQGWVTTGFVEEMIERAKAFLGH